MGRLDGKVCVITGAARGQGAEEARLFSQEGATVWLTDVLDDVGEATARSIGGTYRHLDVRSESDWTTLVAEILQRDRRIDVLVNNAGTNPYFGPLVDIDEVRAAKTVRLNQYGPVMWSRLVWKASMSEHGGSIVNVASVGGLLTEPGIGYYNATKAALIHLTRQMAAELAPGVRVNAVAPGVVRTHLAKALWENFEAQISEALPLKRIGEPDDIAEVIVFLASDAARWMTGQTLVVDGGAQVKYGLS